MRWWSSVGGAWLRLVGVSRSLRGIHTTPVRFGGTLLGPVRFTHIETCASEVCRRFKKMEEMEECVQTLRTLDDLLATLRAELAAARESGSAQDSSGITNSRKVPNYRTMQDGLDLTKAKRLIHARECAIEATKTLIEKYKTTT